MLSNPILKDLRSLFVYILVWCFVGVFYFSLVYWGLKVPLTIAAADSIIFNLLLAAIGLGLWYPSKFIYYEKERFLRFLFTHLFGGAAASAVWLALGYSIANALMPDKDLYNEFFFSTLAWRIFTGFLFYFLLILFYYLINYYSRYQENIQREAELRTLITEAELKSLRFQINPHFIFNSLNSISSLTVTDPAKARTMIIKLADFLRYTASAGAGSMNPLSDELNNIKLYLDIEKIRFEDKFDFTEDISEECRKIPVPSMILQPLFENAIKHSVYEAIDKIHIHLKCGMTDGFLALEVDNNFEKDSDRKGSGVGLKNINERLSLLYKRNDLVKISNADGHFNVKIFIPAGT